MATDVRPLEQHATASREGHIGPGPPGLLKEVKWRVIEREWGIAFGGVLVVLSIYCKFFLSYLLSILSLLYMALLSPPG